MMTTVTRLAMLAMTTMTTSRSALGVGRRGRRAAVRVLSESKARAAQNEKQCENDSESLIHSFDSPSGNIELSSGIGTNGDAPYYRKS